MELVKDPYLQERIPQKIEEISSILSGMPESLLVFVDGFSGAGKDFVIDRTVECFDNSRINVCKSHSKKSTRKPRLDEESYENSRSGTVIVSEKTLNNTQNIFDYEFADNKYAVDFEILKQELDNNKIVFLPLAELSSMNKSRNALSNFIVIQNAIKEALPNIRLLHLSIKAPSVQVTASLEKRVESLEDEVKQRVRYVIGGEDSVYKKALINKGWIRVIENYQEDDIDKYESAYQTLVEIKETLEK